MADVNLMAGSKYALVIKVPDMGDNSQYYRNTSGDPYNGGNLIYSTDGGNSWGDYPNRDLYFEEWGFRQ